MQTKRFTEPPQSFLPFCESVIDDLGTISDFEGDAYHRMTDRISRQARRQHAAKCDD